MQSHTNHVLIHHRLSSSFILVQFVLAKHRFISPPQKTTNGVIDLSGDDTGLLGQPSFFRTIGPNLSYSQDTIGHGRGGGGTRGFYWSRTALGRDLERSSKYSHQKPCLWYFLVFFFGFYFLWCALRGCSFEGSHLWILDFLVLQKSPRIWPEVQLDVFCRVAFGSQKSCEVSDRWRGIFVANSLEVGVLW